MPIDTSFESLDVRFIPRAQAWAEVLTAYVLPVRYPGHKMRVMETRRSPARQAELEAAGASRNKIGFHNYGLALDFGIFAPDGRYLKDDATGIYTTCGIQAEVFGMEWGGRWKSLVDLGHIQFRPDGTNLDKLAEAAGLIA